MSVSYIFQNLFVYNTLYENSLNVQSIYIIVNILKFTVNINTSNTVKFIFRLGNFDSYVTIKVSKIRTVTRCYKVC